MRTTTPTVTNSSPPATPHASWASRQKTVGRLLDNGAIPYIRYTKKGNRWVSRADVLAYHERAHMHHRAHLKNMQEIVTEGNLDDIDYEAYLAQFE
ncbi:MerR family regulatory protein [Bifidobacterium anseris]|uniref:MerR family regulatory protein n=1 Tax=Bifidobacterium anseris TaxID=2020963 RepID=A0A2N5IXB1_9BIFI|nr:MerR family regulatory protein [Bifidobacterium anseris]